MGWLRAPEGVGSLVSVWKDPSFPYRLVGDGWTWTDGQGSSAGVAIRRARHGKDRLIRLGIVRDVTGVLPPDVLWPWAEAEGLEALVCESPAGSVAPAAPEGRAWVELGKVQQLRRVPLWRTFHIPGHKVHRVNPGDAQALAMHLEAHREGLALSPTVSPEAFLEGLALCPGLTLDHFRMVRRDGTLVALAGIWMPGDFHRGDAPGPGPATNVLLRLGSMLGRRSPWPPHVPGDRGQVGFVRVLAYKEGQADAVALLLSALAADMRRWGIRQLGINLGTDDPVAGLLPGGPSQVRRRTLWYAGLTEETQQPPAGLVDPNLLDPW
ncbi:MAG: hypothetical protein VKO21_08770 [Candidatus Sericytochromatia bacterium]|nr:hypothetical protein [Candidatus Sericytochromatia bacterium]